MFFHYQFLQKSLFKTEGKTHGKVGGGVKRVLKI